jgi:hypothetical protein
LPVCITVELYNRDNWWDVKETYQEILLLGGGEQQIGLPDWFHTPTNRLAYDFDEGDWFPSGWKLPRGKYAHWQGAAKAQQKDRKGENPMYDFGFTHIAPFAMTHNGAGGDWARQGLVFGDNAWIPYDGWTSQFTADPSDPKNWMVETFYDYSEQCSIVIADFEAPNYFIWKDYQYEAFADLINKVRKRYPKVEVGCWGVGVTGYSFRIFDQIDEQGRPTGVTDLKAAKQWREKYNHPEAELHPVFRRCNLNIGVPAVYWANNSKPSQLYAFLQEWAMAKLDTGGDTRWLPAFAISLYRCQGEDPAGEPQTAGACLGRLCAFALWTLRDGWAPVLGDRHQLYGGAGGLLGLASRRGDEEA